MTTLTRYEAARQALAEAVSVDEVKDIHDKAEVMRHYAKIAGDIELEQNAAELRIRAKARFGELERMMKADGHLAAGRPKMVSSTEPLSAPIKLADIGVTKKFSSEAQKLASISEQAFEAMVHRIRQNIAERGYKTAQTIEEKKERRAAREKVLAAVQWPQGKFGVILADPEWRFEPYSRDTGLDRSPDNHYPTSVTKEIASRDVQSIAADDCVLFLWATAPMLPEALAVMQAWKFAYKSHCVWNKLRDNQGHGLRKLAVGTGYWFRNAHEILLIGTRGKVPAPAPGTQWSSSVDAPVGKHSAKPEVFLEMIESYFPTMPKIELNRRGPPRSGWAAWGLEAEPVHDPQTGEIHEESSLRRQRKVSNR